MRRELFIPRPSQVPCTLPALCALLTGTLLVLSMTEAPAIGGPCQPTTPCPCAADGTCHPKRDTWGTYITRWRPWPGETVGLTPSQAEAEAGAAEGQLPQLERPRPELEDLRGPAKKTPSAAAGGQPTGAGEVELPGVPEIPGPAEAPGAGEEAPPAGEQNLPPGGFQIPDFQPQGSLQTLPEVEDAPPALPAGIRQALTANGTTLPAVREQPSPSVSANHSKSSALPQLRVTDPRVLPATTLRPIGEIELTNPAAASVYHQDDDQLQHAIYYETAGGSQ